jgi:hypothetical protein
MTEFGLPPLLHLSPKLPAEIPAGKKIKEHILGGITI